MFGISISRSQFTLTLAAVALTAAEPSGRLISSHAIAFNPVNQKVYAVDEAAGKVWVIDGQSGSTVSVKVGLGPDAVAINSLTGRVYVANADDGTVSELDGDTVTRTFKAGTHPYMLAVNGASGKVYVTNTFSDSVAEIDLAMGTTRFLKIGSADNIAVDSRRNKAFMIGYEGADVRVLNGANGKVDKVTAHEHLWGIAVDEATGKLYVTGAGNSDLLALDPQSGVTRVPVGPIPCAVAANARTGSVYVVNYGDDSVSVVDSKTQKVRTVMRVGSHPQAIAVDERTNRIYVVNTHGDSVTVIDGPTNAVLETVAAGRNPYAITTSADPQTVYVANYGEPSFTVVHVKLNVK